MKETTLRFRWLIVIVLLAIIQFSCADDDSDDESVMSDDIANEAAGTPAPNFTLTSVDGGEVSLADFEGTPVVIFFFGNSCPFCIGSAPNVEADINVRFEDDIVVLGIDTWDGSQSSVESFRSNTSVTFDLLLEGSSVQNAYETTYDRLFVIDADGHIAHRGRSATSRELEEVIMVIQDLIQ